MVVDRLEIEIASELKKKCLSYAFEWQSGFWSILTPLNGILRI